MSELLKELGHEVIVANARKLQDLPERLEERPAGRRAACAGGAHGPEAFVPDRAPGAARASGPGGDALEAICEQVLGFDREIRQLSAKVYPETALLNQVGGVGPITALRYVLTIEDPKRIERSRNVGAYLGLRPRQRQSGQRDPELRITKAGDRELRRLLVQCAQQILGPFGKDCDLRRWGLELAGRGGATAKKKAVIAVARKLAVLLHRLWTTGEVYEPMRNANRSAANRMPTAKAS